MFGLDLPVRDAGCGGGEGFGPVLVDHPDTEVNWRRNKHVLVNVECLCVCMLVRFNGRLSQKLVIPC